MTSPSDLFARMPEAMRDIAIELDALLRRVEPALVVAVKRGHPTYRLDGADRFAIVAHAAHVDLQVWSGEELPDPDGVPEGAGMGMRHVTFRTPGEVGRPGVRAVIDQALRRGTRI